MKRILLLLLFNSILLTSYGQWKNAYASSLKLINADSTHGELDGTEYRNAAGKYRYKENGVWKYRLSTTDAAAAFWPLSGDASMTSDVTINTDGHLFQIEGDDSYFNIANFGFELIHNSTTGVYTSGTGLNIQNVSGDINLVTDGATDRDIIFNMGTGSMIIPDAVANDDALTQILARDGTTGEIKYRDVSSISGGGGITNSAAANELMKSDGTNAVGSNVYMTGTSQLDLGNSSLSGSERWIAAQGSASAVSLLLSAKNDLASELQLIAGENGKVMAVSHSFNTSSVLVPFKVRSRAVPGTGLLAGLGVGMAFETQTEDSPSNYELGSVIESVSTDITSGSEDFKLVFKTMAAGATAAQRLVIDNSAVNAYGSLGSVVDDASTNSASLTLDLVHTTTGTPATGIGGFIRMQAETSSGNIEQGARIEWVTTDVTSTSEDFDLVFKNMAAGAAAAETFRITSIGNATLAGTGTGVDWVATSDRRLKYNFKPVGSQLYKIHQIANLVTNYDRKDNGKNETGFVAQELMNVAPEYVNAPVDTAAAYYSVNYSKLVVPLYKGVDELNDEVQALRNEVAELKQIVKEYRRMTYEMSKNLEASSK